ncbi:carboxylesterase 4A-like isoform X1 [Ochotona curzoniae]|uniref:carboxylesterase 4A-like isoform X1 n=1 Tax=Ochotona curzoniae TaxID=130825 RepID=UPI001B34864D|nr:carboxylesterase 4A-like isoform X1 [Ochotona curzoniae]
MKWSQGLFLAVCLVQQAALGAWHIQKPLVVTKYGTLRGKQVYVYRTPIHVFLGVPFSKPPVGARRFAPPEPPEPWKGTRYATTDPPSCLQESWGQLASIYFNTRKRYKWLRFSEDCLYLNVYAPLRAPGDPLWPVMVWFPGGAFLVGSASTYEGSELAAREKVVLVFLQHRLGILGFLSTGDNQARGNWALLDQLAALMWVKENIEAFGGDPNSVTLFGQSSGAISISGLMMSPLAQGLFHRAISQSGTALMKVFITYNPWKVAKKVAHLAGCSQDSSQILVDCLRALPGAKLMRVSKRMRFFHVNICKDPQEMTWIMGAVVDGVVFPDDPEVLLSRGQVLPVPYLLGVNSREFRWLLPFILRFPLNRNLMRKKFLTKLLWNTSSLLNVTKEQIPRAMEEYLRHDRHNWKKYRDHVMDLAGDATFVYCALETARHHRDAGHPVYLYEFEHQTPSIVIIKPCTDGADHGDEIRFVFGTPFFKGPSTAAAKTLSFRIMRYWANFARTGNPNDGTVPYWPQFDKKEQYLRLDFNVRVGEKLRQEKMAFWVRMRQPQRPRKHGQS